MTDLQLAPEPSREEREATRKKQLLRAEYKARLNENWFFDAAGEPQKNNWSHLEWFRLYETHNRLLIEAAREHAKTQVFAIALPLMEMALNPNVRILLISDTFGKSQERTKVLRQHIEHNERIREDTNNRLHIDRKSGDEQFTLEREHYWLKEPTVTSTYAGAGISGGRWDLIIADDLINYLQNANTPGKRKRLSRWWADEVENSVTRDGKIVLIGTHQHPEDLYEELKGRPEYHVAVYPAVDEEDTGYGNLGYAEKNFKHAGITGPDALCLWPQMFSYEKHMAKKNNPATHDSYLRQQQQLAVPETGLVFDKPLMDAAFERGKSVAYDPNATQFIGYDPGYSQRAAMLCFQERAGDYIDMWKEHSFTHVADDDQVKVLAAHCKRYNVEAVFIDDADPGLRAKIKKEFTRYSIKTKIVPVRFNRHKRNCIKATRWLLQTQRLSWTLDKTIRHTAHTTREVDPIFHSEMKNYAFREGEDMPQKQDDHGPDAHLAYSVKHIKPWLRAVEQEELPENVVKIA